MESLKIPCTSFLFNVLELATSNRVGVSYSLLLMCFFKWESHLHPEYTIPAPVVWSDFSQPARSKGAEVGVRPSRSRCQDPSRGHGEVSPETMVDIGDLHLFETIYGVFNNYV